MKYNELTKECILLLAVVPPVYKAPEMGSLAHWGGGWHRSVHQKGENQSLGARFKEWSQNKNEISI